MQLQLEMPVIDIDVAKLVVFNVDALGSLWRVNSMGRRAGEVGKSLGTICLKHASGYESVLQFEDGKIETFNPHELAPYNNQVERQP